MSKRLILTENEILEIKGLYGLINEAAKAINASTSPERMANFTPNGNQKFGLKGDASKENYYFKTTLGSLVTASTGTPETFLSSFTPATDAGQYVDYVRVGNSELTNKGNISFDLKSLPDTTEVLATHNGLLVLRRMMDQLKGVKEGKVTLSMSAEQRASGQKTYDVKEIPSKLQTTFNTLQTGLTVLIVPTEERGKISDEYAKTYFVSRGDDEIKRNVQTSIKNALVNIFLAKEDIPDREKIITDKGLVTTVDLSAFENFYGKGLKKDELNKPWSDLQNEIKKVMISNFKLYLPSEFAYLADNVGNLIQNTYSSSYFKKGYDELFKGTKMMQGSPESKATKTQTSTSYEMGK
jgi:hypothetical protein